MIKHSIAPYTYKVEPYQPFQHAQPHARAHWHAPPNDWNDGDYVAVRVLSHGNGGFINYKVTQFTDKIHYAMWLNELPFKKGDYLVRKKNPYPPKAEEIFRCNGFQEVHHFVSWSKDGRAMAMEVVDALGNRTWVTVKEWAKFHSIDAHPEKKFDLPVD